MKSLKSRRQFPLQMLGLAGVTAVLAKAQAPKQNVSGAKHPNIAAAQRFCEQAYEKVTAAQQANEWDMAGHAAHAKDLLDQANAALKQAATAANKNAK
jgi:hypothetical protein